MDTKGKNFDDLKDSSHNKPLVSVDQEKVELNGAMRVHTEEESLLAPPRRGGLSNKSGKPKLKVQWNDNVGNKLAEIVEFQPSDVSDSEDEDADSDACICAIM